MVLVKLDTLFNYLNRNGELILDSSVSSAKKFENGFATIKANNKFSVINRKGEIVLKNQIRPIKFNKTGIGVYYDKKRFGLATPRTVALVPYACVAATAAVWA